MTFGSLQAAVRGRKRELPVVKMDAPLTAEQCNAQWYAHCVKRCLMDAALICEQYGLNLGVLAAELEREITREDAR